MSDLNWIMSQSFLVVRFYDMPNLFICLLFVVFGCRILKVSRMAEAVLLVHCLLPLFINGVLFPFSYMPDALGYWRGVNAIRSGELGFFESLSLGNVERAAAMFTLLPFPMAITPLSLGFYNTFLYVALFFWLHRKNVFTNVSMWFYLLYPSLLIYTSMGLRDTFILVFMVVAVQWAREGRWLLFWLPLGMLYLIKFQNFFILAPPLLIYVWFGIRHAGVSLKNGLFTLCVGMGALMALAPTFLPLVNYFRAAMFVEDGGQREQVALIDGPREFVQEGFSSGIYFLLKPFPWEAGSVFQMIQSVENIVIAIYLIFVIRAASRRVPRKLIFWLLFMIFAFSIYGLVVFNYGTAARYRYPFIVIFILFVCSDCRVYHLLKPIVPVYWRPNKVRSPSPKYNTL